MQSLLVKDYMLTRPVTFKLGMSLEEAVAKLTHAGQLGGPVVDAEMRVVGWISEQDMMQQMLESTYHCEQHSQVDDIMRKEVISVSPNTSILELAQQMGQSRPKNYPVVEDGRLVGVISRHHVIKAMQKHLNSCYVHA